MAVGVYVGPDLGQRVISRQHAVEDHVVVQGDEDDLLLSERFGYEQVVVVWIPRVLPTCQPQKFLQVPGQSEVLSLLEVERGVLVAVSDECLDGDALARGFSAVDDASYFRSRVPCHRVVVESR